MIVAPVRIGIALLVTTVALLMGATAALAAPGDPPCQSVCLAVDQTQAAPNDVVGFQITGTEAFSSYTLTVNGNFVASGSDPAGNGVDDKFKMLDLGSAEQDITVEATVSQPSAPDQPFVGSATMHYLPVAITPTGPTTDPQPVPVALAPVPASELDPLPAQIDDTILPGVAHEKKKVRHHKKQTDNTGTSKPTTGNVTAPVTTAPITSSPVTSTTSAITGAVTHVKAPKLTVPKTPKSTLPPPSSGSSTPSTSTSSLASGLAAPITGTASLAADGGFPKVLLVALVLLGLAALAVAAIRMRDLDWGRVRFAFPGGQDPDEIRLGALSRAARSGAEVQQGIALRKASRR